MTAHTKLVNDILVAIYRHYARRACVQRIAVIDAVASVRGGGTRHVKSAQPGTGDIIGCIDTLPLAIEAKVEKDKQRPSQVEFMEAWRMAGGCYLVIRDSTNGLIDLIELHLEAMR
jgi:hypothetical protein